MNVYLSFQITRFKKIVCYEYDTRFDLLVFFAPLSMESEMRGRELMNLKAPEGTPLIFASRVTVEVILGKNSAFVSIVLRMEIK